LKGWTLVSMVAFRAQDQVKDVGGDLAAHEATGVYGCDRVGMCFFVLVTLDVRHSLGHESRLANLWILSGPRGTSDTWLGWVWSTGFARVFDLSFSSLSRNMAIWIPIILAVSH